MNSWIKNARCFALRAIVLSWATAMATTPTAATAQTATSNGKANKEDTTKGVSSGRKHQEFAQSEVPHCIRNLGTVTIVEPGNRWWRKLNLGSPEAILRTFVQQSGCFTLVNRDHSQQTSAIAEQGELQAGSNVGKDQIKAADYFLQPDIVSTNSNSGDGLKDVGALALFRRSVGRSVGGINIVKGEANVTLSVVNGRTTAEEALTEGYARKSEVSFGAGGGFIGGTFAEAGGGGYQNTKIGQIIVLAYLDAYTKLVTQLGGLPENAAGAAPTTNPSNEVAISIANQRSPIGAGFIPWPPPQPSSMGEISANFRLSESFGYIDAQIRSKLAARGYSQLLYFRIPGGFGIVTHLERLDSLGKPITQGRWSKTKLPVRGGFFDYIRNLFSGDDGHFRLFAFMVTDQDFQPQSNFATEENLNTWSSLGRPYMSRSLAAIAPSKNTRVWLMTYEFVCSHSKGGTLVSDVDGAFSFAVHKEFLGLR